LVGSRGLFGSFSSLTKKAFGRQVPEPIDTDADDPAERFSFAQKAFGRSDEGVAKAIDVTYEKFLLYLGIVACLIALNIGGLRTIGHAIPIWLDLAGRLGPVAIALSMALRAAFENWQLRTRKLGSLRDFRKDPFAWWAQPAPGWMSKAQGPLTMLFLVASSAVAGVILLSASSALADSPTIASTIFASPTASDFWYKLLGYVFPQVGPVKIGTVMPIDNGIGQAFGAMSAALMACASIMMSYQIVHGMVETAHSGEPLGNRYHTIWGPIRVAYGIGMLAPITGGYCVAQMVVLTVAIAGGQIANVEWSAFVSGLNSSTINAPSLEETLPLVRDTLLLETCYAVASHMGLDNTPTTWPATYSPGPVSLSNNGVVRGVSQIWHSIVGMWDSAQNAGTQNPVATAQARWDYGYCGSITGDYSTNSAAADADVLALDKSRIAAYDALRATLHATATTISNSVSPEMGVNWTDAQTPLFAAVLQAKATYDNAIVTAVQTYTNSASKIDLSKFQTAATAHGWITAGAFYMTLARIDAQVLSLTHVSPTVIIGNGSPKDSRSDGVDRMFNLTTGAITHLREWWDTNVGGSTTLSMAAVNAGRFQNSGSIAGATEYFGSVDSGVQAWILKQAAITPGQGTGLQKMVDFGNILLTVCEGILVALGAGALFGAAASATPEGALAKLVKEMTPVGAVIDKVMGAAMVFAMMIAIALLMAGVLHSYILPLMPFMLFTFAVMDLLVMVVCGVIAAPIWALFHVTFEGEELLKGRHNEGYMINFNLLLRPGLTLFGLFFSMHVFEAMVWLLSVTVYPAMASATAGHFFGPIGTIVYVIIISVLNYQIAVRSFHLITQVPNRVVRWFGASPDGDGGEGNASSTMGLVMAHSEKGIGTAASAARGAGGVVAGAAGAAAPVTATAKSASNLASEMSQAGNTVGKAGRGEVG
jgi:conjugal transfer/type IV secretion protein DotA/TraY